MASIKRDVSLSTNTKRDKRYRGNKHRRARRSSLLPRRKLGMEVVSSFFFPSHERENEPEVERKELFS